MFHQKRGIRITGAYLIKPLCALDNANWLRTNIYTVDSRYLEVEGTR